MIILLILLLLLSPCLSIAGTYYVSPTGAASWANCEDAAGTPGPKSGTSACSLDTANINVQAGDTVYLRAGTYTLSGGNAYDMGVSPQTTGTLVGSTCTSKIIYQNYTGEEPIITGSATHNGIYLIKKSCIKVSGITFSNIGTYAQLQEAHYNEITNCKFGETAEGGFGIYLFSGCAVTSCSGSGTPWTCCTGSGTGTCDYNCWNTHNWIHGNTIAKVVKPTGSERCDEGVDIIRIGDDDSARASTLAQGNNNNTIEDNVLYHVGHTMLENYGNYNVIRNNTFHNEPWYDGCTHWDGGGTYVSSSTLTIGTGSKTFTTNAGIGITLPGTHVVSVLKSTDLSVGMKGVVTAYNNETGEMTITVSSGWTSGTCVACNSWRIGVNHNVPVYTNAAYAGLYGHRNIQLTDAYARAAMYTLLEGNRIGHASANPNNDGAENLTLAGPGNIIRYNYLYNSMASGIAYKYADGDCVPGTKDHAGACGAINNRIYNNTIYKSGTGINWRVHGSNNMSYAGQGIAQARSTGTGNLNNVIKNNIVYDNKEGAICSHTLYTGDYSTTQCSEQSYDTVSNNFVGGTGDSPTNDPLFVNPDVTDATSLVLPNLALQGSSTAINGGTYLTTVHADDTSSGTSLILSDNTYFQAGSSASTIPVGSKLSTVAGDWILVGATVAAAQSTQITDVVAYSTTKGTVTISPAITRNDGDYVWLYKKSDGTQVLYDTAPDYGAYEYPNVKRTIFRP